MLNRRTFLQWLGSLGAGAFYVMSAAHTKFRAELPDNQTGPLAMRGWREIATRIDAEQLVRRYTTLDTVTETMIHPDRLRGRCPFCHTEWDSLLVYSQENLYSCEECGTDGCVIDFYARIQGVSYREATWRLRTMLHAGELRERLSVANI